MIQFLTSRLLSTVSSEISVETFKYFFFFGIVYFLMYFWLGDERSDASIVRLETEAAVYGSRRRLFRQTLRGPAIGVDVETASGSRARRACIM